MDSIGDLSSLSNDNIKKALIKIIENEFKYKKYSIDIESGSSKGDNYIGIVYRAKIKPIESDKQNTNDVDADVQLKPTSIIIKLPPQTAARREYFFTRPCFLRESMVYDELIPLYMKFQESKGIIPHENGFFEVPECYKCLTDDGLEGIFLRDLRLDGFEMFSRFESVTVDHVKLIMKALGKFHAISYAIKDQYPEKFAKYKDIIDIFATREDDPQLLEYFQSLLDTARDTICPEKEKTLLDRINNIFEGREFMDVLKELVSGKRAEPYAIVCHGDCWNNNILFKYKDEKPTEIRLIDWQVARYASPVCDLMYYIFSCTTKTLRDKYYFEFLDTYYNSLSDLLRRLGSNPEHLFPRKAFDSQLKLFGSFGFLMALMLIPILTMEAEDIPDLDEVAEQMRAGEFNVQEAFTAEKTQGAYRERMRDVIEDMINLGYI